jgi:hypothetical protein
MKWMSCSACRADIATGARYWACSVSTCNRARTRLVFCSVACWDSHVSLLRHRDAWAVEETAPGTVTAAAAPTPTPAPAPVVAAPAPAAKLDDDVLIVVSRMKKYIKDRSTLACADAVADALTIHVRALCDQAIRAAAADGRKTVLERDVPRLR